MNAKRISQIAVIAIMAGSICGCVYPRYGRWASVWDVYVPSDDLSVSVGSSVPVVSRYDYSPSYLTGYYRFSSNDYCYPYGYRSIFDRGGSNILVGHSNRYSNIYRPISCRTNDGIFRSSGYGGIYWGTGWRTNDSVFRHPRVDSTYRPSDRDRPSHSDRLHREPIAMPKPQCTPSINSGFVPGRTRGGSGNSGAIVQRSKPTSSIIVGRGKQPSSNFNTGRSNFQSPSVSSYGAGVSSSRMSFSP